jgi:MFS family permease
VIDETQSVGQHGAMSARAVRSVSPLWRHGGFLRLWSGESLSQFGAQLSHLALPVLAVSILQATPFEVGVLGAVDTAAFLLIGLPAGAWIDRMLKRRIMLTADLVRAVALAAIPALWLADALQFWHLYVVGAVLGVATVFFDVAYQSFVPVLVPSTSIADANGKLESTAQIARIGGPAAGGALLTIVAAPFVLAATALTYLTSFVVLTRIRDDERLPDRADRRPLPAEIREGLAYVVRHPLLSRITAATSINNLFATIAMTMTPLLVLRELGLSPAVMGLVLSVGSIGGLLGALASPWIASHLGEGTAIPVSCLAGGLFTLLLPFSAVVPGVSIAVLIVAEFGLAFAVLVYNITQVSFRQRVCPPRLLGRMNASIRFLVWGVMPIGALASGMLGSGIGVVPTMWIGAVGALFAAVPVWFSPLLGMRRLPEE